MNQTAKKLRDIAQNAGVTPDSGKPYSVIATIKSAFGFDSILAAEVLLQFIAAIADELDELQARATEANNLRKKLESAEDKAERRKQYIGYLETALHDKNALLEQRGGTIARLTAECSELRKQAPSERERHILDIWPRFEDGELVMVGDRVGHPVEKVDSITILESAFVLCDDAASSAQYERGQCVKRPVQSVLDADGVEIRLGDTVWHCIGIYDELVVEEIDDESGWVRTRSANGACLSVYNTHLTHIAPDSWEQLEEDAEFNDETGIVGGNLDIVRRAKALAGVEVSE